MFEECDFSTSHESAYQAAPEASTLPENPLLLLLRAHEDLEKSDSVYASYDYDSESGVDKSHSMKQRIADKVMRILPQGAC